MQREDGYQPWFWMLFWASTVAFLAFAATWIVILAHVLDTLFDDGIPGAGHLVMALAVPLVFYAPLAVRIYDRRCAHLNAAPGRMFRVGSLVLPVLMGMGLVLVFIGALRSFAITGVGLGLVSLCVLIHLILWSKDVRPDRVSEGGEV